MLANSFQELHDGIAAALGDEPVALPQDEVLGASFALHVHGVEVTFSHRRETGRECAIAMVHLGHAAARFEAALIRQLMELTFDSMSHATALVALRHPVTREFYLGFSFPLANASVGELFAKLDAIAAWRNACELLATRPVGGAPA